MFFTTYSGGLGQAVPQLDPRTLSIGSTLSEAENMLKQAFNALQIASVTAPDVPIRTELIQAYQTARAGFVGAAQVWIDGYNATPTDLRNPNDPNARPTLPPDKARVQGTGAHLQPSVDGPAAQALGLPARGLTWQTPALQGATWLTSSTRSSTARTSARGRRASTS